MPTMRPDTPPPIGTPCRVYRNIQTGLWSVQTRVALPTGGKGWRVTHSVHAVAVDCTELKVHPKALETMRANFAARGKGKRVCLEVVGTIAPMPADPEAGVPVRFDPLDDDLAWTTDDDRPYSGGGTLSFPQGGSCGFLS